MISIDRVHRYLLGGVLTGLMFVASKAFEYFLKFAHGITPATNDFYMWYFTLTGIHLLHVVFGTCLLTYVWTRARRGATSSSHRSCRNALPRTGIWSTCCGSCSSRCSICRRHCDVGVA